MRFFHLLLCLCAAPLAAADVLYLENGDRITGKAGAVADGALVFNPAYGGEIMVPLEEVALLETDEGEELPAAEIPAELPPAEETPAEEAPPEEPWSGSVDTSATWRSGNTDTFDWTLSGSLSYTKPKNVLTLSTAAGYGEVEDEINTRRLKGELKWEYHPNGKLYVWNLAGAEYDDGRKLDFRGTLASGLGYDFIQREERELSGELGLDYAWEEWAPFTPEEREDEKEALRVEALASLRGLWGDVAAGNRPLTLRVLRDVLAYGDQYQNPLEGFENRQEDYLSVRIALDYREQLFQASQLTNNLVLLPNVTEFGEFRMTNVLALSTPLTEALSWKTSLESAYDSLAQDNGAEPWDNTLRTGLRYSF